MVGPNQTLMRHLRSPLITKLCGDFALTLVVVEGETPTWAELALAKPCALAAIELHADNASLFEEIARVKAASPATRVVLVSSGRLASAQLALIAASGCDEVLVAPITTDELYDVLCVHLRLPRHGTRAARVAIVRAGVELGEATNISTDGVRFLTSDNISEGTGLEVVISQPGEADVAIAATVIWTQPRDGQHIAGAGFGFLDERTTELLARLTQWEIIDETNRTRVVMKGHITEATSFASLLDIVVGRVDFDMSQVRYINSLGVARWCEFLEAAPLQGYEFHTCSVPFMLQASRVTGMLGSGTISSLFAPYLCAACGHGEERLLHSAALLAAGGSAPVFRCEACGGELMMDELPERYFSFLKKS